MPNFEEIWPSGKPRRQRRGAPSAPTKGIAYIEHAMATGILGEKDKDFTTVGKPKVNNTVNDVYSGKNGQAPEVRFNGRFR